jgi:hypothetical protein
MVEGGSVAWDMEDGSPIGGMWMACYDRIERCR